MNDDKAKRALNRLCSHVETDVDLCNCLDQDCERCNALRHALQAIDDRATLIRWHYDEIGEVTEAMLDEMAEAHHAARRHMRGE